MELARQHGLYAVAHPLRLDYVGLKRVSKESRSLEKKKVSIAGIRGIDRAASGDAAECVIEFESSSWKQDAHSVEGFRGA